MSSTIEKLSPEELEAYKERVRARHLQAGQQSGALEAFGESHSLNTWAKLLGLAKTSLWRYIHKGLTIEEVCELRDIKY